MFNKLRQSISEKLAPTQANPSQKSFYRDPLWINESAFGSTMQLQQNKFGASLAFNLTVPVYSAVNYRVKTVGRAYWSIKDLDDNIISDSENTQAQGLVAKAIYDFERRMNINFFGAWELSRSVAGETYIQFVENDYGIITGLDWLNPLAVSPYAPMGNIQWYDYQPYGQRLQIPIDMMLFDRQLNLQDETVGQSPVEVAIRKAQTIINGDLTMLYHLKNNARAGMTISPPIGRAQTDPKMSAFSDEDMQGIKDGVLRTMRGSGNHNSTIVLPFPVDINTYEIANIQPVIDLMDRVDKSIYEVLNVPPAIAGNPDTSRFQRSEQDVVVAHEMIVNELLDIQKYMNRVVIPRFDPRRRTRFEFDLSPFLHITTEDIQVVDATIRLYSSGILQKRDAIQMNSSLLKTRGLDVQRLLDDAEIVDDIELQVESAVDDSIPSQEQLLSTPSKHSKKNPDRMTFEYETIDIQNIISELSAYRKFISNGKSASKFECHYIVGEIYDAIHDAKFSTSEIDRQISILIETQKSINGLSTQFKTDVARILDTAKTRDSLFTQLNNLVTIMGNRAYAEGLMTAGVRDEPNEDDRTTISQVQERQMEYINNLADAMFSDNPPSEAQIALKPEQWVNKTLLEFFNEGLLSGRANPMLEWNIDPEKDNCSDCLNLDGIRARATDWRRSKWRPQGSMLECGGHFCGCSLDVTVGRSRGRIPA